MEFKNGDRVRLKGTKSVGLKEWQEYFGSFGIVKGDLATIKETHDGEYFVITDKPRGSDSGRLSIVDIEPIVNSLKEFINNPYKGN